MIYYSRFEQTSEEFPDIECALEPKFKVGDKVSLIGHDLPWTVAGMELIEDPRARVIFGNFTYSVEGEPGMPISSFGENDLELYVKPEPKVIDEIPISFVLSCSCGGEALSIDVLDEYAYINIFYNRSKTIRRTVFERVRNAWYMLIGKDYKVIDLVFPVREIKKKFKEFIENN